MKKIIIASLLISNICYETYTVLPAGVIQLTTAPFNGGGQIKDVKVDANGKILACGYVSVSGPSRWIVARFTSTGALDTTFNAAGTPGYQLWSNNGSIANAMTIQADGKIVVVGVSGSFVATLFRYTSAGAIDTGGNALSISGVNTNTSAVGVTIDNTGTYLLCSVARNVSNSSGQQVRCRVTISGLSPAIGAGRNAASNNPGAPSDFVGGAVTLPTSNNLVCIGSFFGASNSWWRTINTSPYTTDIDATQATGGFVHNIVSIANPPDDNVFISYWNSSTNKHQLYLTTGTFSLLTAVDVLANTNAGLPYNVGGGLALTATNTKIFLCASTTLNGSSQPFISRLIASGGGLDTTFNTVGYTIQTQAELVPGYYAAVANDSNNKAVVGGFGGSSSYWTLARYNTDGTLDTTFNGSINLTGLLRDTASPFSATTAGLILTTTIDQSGKLLAGGNSGTASALIRYNTTGSPRDTSFSDDGVALGDLAATATINKVINQAGTDYLVAGISGSQQFTTAKYQVSDGSLNTAYGTGGIVQETVGAAGISAAYDMLLNGTALGVCGYAYTNTPIVINYHSGTGERDASLGNNGMQQFAYLGNGRIYGITAPTGGSRYGAGQGTSSNIAFLRLLANGTGVLQDTASPFNTSLAGLITTTTIDQSGKLLAGGNYGTGSALMRYNTTGTPRNSSSGFGANGVVYNSLLTTATINKVINATSNGYLVAGVSSTNQFTVASYTNAGAANTTFNTTGTVTEANIGPSAAYDMLLSGETLGVCGYAYSTTPILINYNSSTGARTSIQEFPAIGDGTMYGITAIGANRYGAGQGVSSNTAFLRLLMDGTGLLQDTASPFSESGNGIVYGECIDALGNITLCGSYNNTWMIVKYSNTAARVTSFNGDGVVLDSSLGVATAKALIQDTNGNYYVAGESTVNGTTVLTVAKYSNVGELVASFGTNGIVQLPSVTYGQSRATSLVLTADNRLLVTGQVTVDGTLYAALVAYDQSGALLTTFGTNGVQVYQDLGTGIVNTVVSNQETDTATAGGQTTNQATLLQVAQTSPAAAVIASGM